MGFSTKTAFSSSSQQSSPKPSLFGMLAHGNLQEFIFKKRKPSNKANDPIKEFAGLSINDVRKVDNSDASSLNSKRKAEISAASPAISTFSLEPATGSSTTLRKKYGKCGKNLGNGSYSSCFAVKTISGKTFAVKEFKNSLNLSERSWRKTLTSEYCIGSLLHHPNVIETLDLILEKKHAYEVMEFCKGADLNEVITHSNMSTDEINCVFAQLLQGVAYMHKNGVAHRDIKPENCLLDENNHLKIIDFGCATVFQTPFETNPRPCSGICGTQPYMAPEEYTEKFYDGRKVDVWSCGIVYAVMNLKSFPWERAQSSDTMYRKYLTNKTAFPCFSQLNEVSRSLCLDILNPDPSLRLTCVELIALLKYKQQDV